MSYTILYRSMFAKVGDDRYIPMIEVGDSNCYEGSGRYERRCRDWSNWRVLGHEEKLILSKREIMQGVYKLLDDYNTRYVNKPIHGDEKNGYWTYKSVEKNFGYLSAIAVSGRHTSMTTARMVANFFKRGFDNCLDLTGGRWANIGHIPIVLRHRNSEGVTENTTFNTLGEMVESLCSADGKKCWLEYDYSADSIWDYVRKKR